MNIESIEESIRAQMEGDEIPMKCYSCHEEVQMRKREVLASSPNVLIVHLQRIAQGPRGTAEKINSFCQFPNELDLKPFSFHAVVGSEKDNQKLKTEEEILNDQREYDEEEDEARKEELAESMQPLDEDCWQYKLVGVNVHFGNANQGHYWSYINTNRSGDRIDGDWNQTENWMEYNDQQVHDWDFKRNVRTRCFGSKDVKEFGSGHSGTSAYMLFYERVKKKDIRLVLTPGIQGKIKELTKAATEQDGMAGFASYLREKADGEKEKVE